MTLLKEADLKDIQGLALSGYGHLSHVEYTLLEFRNQEGARRWLAGIVDDITDASRYETAADGSRVKPGGTLNIAFTRHGLNALGLPQDAVGSFSREYYEGMPRRAPILGDCGASAPDEWESGYLDEQRIHALLMIYRPGDASPDDLHKARQKHLAGTDDVVPIVTELGERLPEMREPFGFRDGLSQPRVEGIAEYTTASGPIIRTGEFILGHENEYGILPPTPGIKAELDRRGILPPFPELPGYRDLGRNGTYLVYRKLRQHVKEFWQFMAAHTRQRPGEKPSPDWHLRQRHLAARLLGRWPDGKPLVLYPHTDEDGWGRGREHRTSFEYMKLDPHGYRCPLGAHIRRANPRDNILEDSAKESLLTTSRHRIIRRGIPYGPRAVHPDVLDDVAAPITIQQPDTERGLLFIVVNASIKRQYEFVQEEWANNVAFNGLFSNPDAIISATAAAACGTTHRASDMTMQAQPLRSRLLDVPRFVDVRGGAYLFMPSLTTLRYLASGQPGRAA
jgi:deferrochelatase/peroxidase EfeB